MCQVARPGTEASARFSRSSTGKQITWLTRETEAVGLSPYSIRRWLATMALRDGEDLKTISSALGHSSTAAIEQIYAFVL